MSFWTCFEFFEFFEFLDLADCRGVVFSVESLIHTAPDVRDKTLDETTRKESRSEDALYEHWTKWMGIDAYTKHETQH